MRDITTDPQSAAIARTIIGMGRGLGMRVLAEGVEAHERLVYLREHACEEMQGHFSQPPGPRRRGAGTPGRRAAHTRLSAV